MIKIAREGDKWGALTCTYVGPTEVKEDEGGGITTTRRVNVYQFQCECGGELVVPKTEFRGKRMIQDCGCGRADATRKMMVSLSMPIGLRGQVREIADTNGSTFSQTASMLLRWGVERWKGGQKEYGKELDHKAGRVEKAVKQEKKQVEYGPDDGRFDW